MSDVRWQVSGKPGFPIKTVFFVLSVFLVISIKSFGQSTEQQFLSDIDRLEAVPNERQALNKTIEGVKLFPQSVLLLTRASELYCRIGVREKTASKRQEFYDAGLVYATKSLELAPQSDLSHTVMAMSLGVALLEKSNKEKIAGVREIKSHCEKAVTINPNNFKAWYVLGRWHAEVSNLNVFERTAVKLFYGGLPAASLDRAIMFYSKARTLKPDFILNLLELAKAYKRDDEDAKAKDALQQLLRQRSQTEDDPQFKKEAEKLLKSL